MKQLFATVALLLCATAANAQSEQDRKFADSMTKHHRDGIRMSQLAVQKSSHEELRAMAQKMIDDQTRDIERMQALRGNGPVTPMHEMHQMPGMMPEEQMNEHMTKLESLSGHDFDVAFTEMMPMHHQGAITMAKHEVENGSLEGMKEIAREIAAKQTEERQQLLAMHERFTAGHDRTMTQKE